MYFGDHFFNTPFTNKEIYFLKGLPLQIIFNFNFFFYMAYNTKNSFCLQYYTPWPLTTSGRAQDRTRNRTRNSSLIQHYTPWPLTTSGRAQDRTRNRTRNSSLIQHYTPWP